MERSRGTGNLSLRYNVTQANHIAIRRAIWQRYWLTSRFPLWLSSTANVIALIVHTGHRHRAHDIGFALETAGLADRLIASIRRWFPADLAQRGFDGFAKRNSSLCDDSRSRRLNTSGSRATSPDQQMESFPFFLSRNLTQTKRITNSLLLGNFYVK